MKCNNLICASTRGHWHRQNMPTIGEITMNINNIYIYTHRNQVQQTICASTKGHWPALA